MLCEAVFPALPAIDSYRLHQWTELIFKDSATTMNRDYTWTRRGRDIILRQIDPVIHMDWKEVVAPPMGASVRFQLTAHVRIGGHRRSNTNKDDNHAWIERICTDSGLMLHDVDFDVVSIPIEKPGNIHTLKASRFRGSATVEYPDLVLTALAKGLGNAKAWGLGMLQLSTKG